MQAVQQQSEILWRNIKLNCTSPGVSPCRTRDAWIGVYSGKNDTNNNAIGTPAKSQVHPVQSSSQQTLPNILAAKYPSKSSKVMTITDYIANFIIKDLRPYRIVDSPEFRTMVKALDPRY